MPPKPELTYVVSADGKRHLTIPSDQVAAVTAFVKDTARGDIAHIETTVQEGHDALLAALEGVSEAQAAFKPGPDDWSILELLAHVATIKIGITGVAGSLAQGRMPDGYDDTWEEEANQDGMTRITFDSLDKARAALSAGHAAMLAYIRGLDSGTVNTETTFKHFVFGAFNAREWPAFQRIHDGDHTPQIGDIKAAPGYPKA